MRSWVIGNSPECDVVVNSPVVSSRHCQLTQIVDGFSLEDLGSTNGTYVNGSRITAPTRISYGAEITLARTLPMPWPPEVVRYVTIGRVAGNDIVLDDLRVSSRHARLVYFTGCPTLIEDLGSSNGTFLNSIDRRVTVATPLTESDTVYFGTFSVPAARLLSGHKESKDAVVAASPPTIALKPSRELTSGKPSFTIPLAGVRHFALLAQAPVLGILIVVFLGRQAAAAITESSWTSVAQGVANTTFALSVAAIWLGCSFAIAESAAGRSPGRQTSVDMAAFLAALGSRLIILLAFCAAASTLLLAIVCWGSGLKGPTLSIWGLTVLTAAVGLMIGLVVKAFSRTWKAAAAILVACVLAMIVLGGLLWPISTNWAARLAAAAMPSRWAFEGMLLLEADARANVQPGSVDPRALLSDVTEFYFPADSERMGTRADVLALGSMLIGMLATVVLVAGSGTPDVDGVS